METLKTEFQQAATYAKKSIDLLSNKTLFISGATGFFGKWLLGTIVWANKNFNSNIKLIALSRNPKKFKDQFPELSENIVFIEGNIKSFTFPEEKLDYIIHAATEASAKLNNERPEVMYEDIVSGMETILKLANKNKVEGILHTSSGAIYGKQPPDLSNIPESYQDYVDPSYNAYAEGKRAAERLANTVASKNNLRVVHARCFAFGGAFLPLDTHFAIGNFIQNCLKGENIKILGDGSPFRSYMYSADLIVWLLKLLVHGRSGESYNVGSPEAISIKELAEEVVSFFPELEVEIAKERDPSIKPSRYVPCVKKAQNEFELKLHYKVNQIVEKMIKFNS